MAGKGRRNQGQVPGRDDADLILADFDSDQAARLRRLFFWKNRQRKQAANEGKVRSLDSCFLNSLRG